MDLLKDDLKKLYFRFLIPSLGSAIVISGILWIGYGVGMPVLLRVMGGNDILYPYAMAGVLLGGAANIVLLFNIQILKYCGDAALSVYSVISNCVILFNSLFTGVGQSVQPILATNYGAGKWDRIQKVRKMSFLTIAVMGLSGRCNAVAAMAGGVVSSHCGLGTLGVLYIAL